MRSLEFRRVVVLLMAVLATWSVLLVGRSTEGVGLQAGGIALETFVADHELEIEDTAALQVAQEEAAAAVPNQYLHNTSEEQERQEALTAFFAAIRGGVATEASPVVSSIPDPLPPVDTTDDSSTTTLPAESVDVEGRVFIDADGNAVYEPVDGALVTDRGLVGIDVTLVDELGGRTSATTQGDGSFRASGVAAGEVTLILDPADPEFPNNWDHYPAELVAVTPLESRTLDCRAGRVCSAPALGFAPLVRPLEDQVARLEAIYPNLESALPVLVRIAIDDMVRVAAGESAWLVDAEAAATNRLLVEFREEVITFDDLQKAQALLDDNPPLVRFGPTSVELEGSKEAVAMVVSAFLSENMTFDADETDRLRLEAREEVLPIQVVYLPGQTIVEEGAPLEEKHIAAIDQLNRISDLDARRLSLLSLVTVLVAVLSFYIARFRPNTWNRTRHLALLFLLVVLGAASVRLAIAFQETAGWYLLPAVALGFLAAILFDSRVGALMAVTMAILVAAGGGDAGASVYAMLATMAPIGFVSSISTRRATRLAVVASSAVAAAIAAATSWFFHSGASPSIQQIGSDVGWAAGTSLVGALFAVAALSFLEGAFDVTTNLRLLDVTDRNHEALQLLQDKAFGSFNHSLMVGTLADAAARAVGANNLLARAAAYYHDLGKIEEAVFFIENQFGMSNPHDELPPEQSVEVIRRHVTRGVEMARRFRIPADVAEGILTHHGDSVMRYFYERARQRYGDDVDMNDYRHRGRRPRTKEMAIVMMCDSVESASRGEFQIDDPTPEKIAALVDRVIAEKVNDGQLSESELTLGDLSKVRRALVESLIGHYHQRIPYPNFPGVANRPLPKLPEPGRD